MIKDLLTNNELLWRLDIIVWIIVGVLALVYIRNNKEKKLNYSDPVLNTIIPILRIYVIFLIIDYVLRISNFLWLESIHTKLLTDWINRDKTFSIDTLIKMGKMLIVLFPYRGVFYIAATGQILCLYKLIYFIVKFRSYFFLDRNFIFTEPVSDMNGQWTGKWKKSHYTKRSFKQVVKKVYVEAIEVRNYFEPICAELIGDNESEELKWKKYNENPKLYLSAVKLYTSILSFQNACLSFQSAYTQNRISQIVKYTLGDVRKKQVEYADKIRDFAEEFNKKFHDTKDLEKRQILDDLKERGYLD